MRHAGIEIGGTKIQLVLGTPEGDIQASARHAVDAAQGAKGILRQIESTLRSWLETGPISAIGVGFGGPVDFQAGKIGRSHQIEGWENFDIDAWLRRITDARVVLENDANTAALGEAWRGAGRGGRSVFYLTLGSGVGGGLVVDGRIYHGAFPGECEIGHLRFGPKGTTLENECSGWAVDRKIRQAIEADPSGPLAQLAAGAGSGEARFLEPAIQAGDRAAIKILEDTAVCIAWGLSQAVHLLHPEIVVFGGGLSLLGERLRRAVADALPGLLIEAFRPGPRLALAELGERAVPTGALLLTRTSPPRVSRDFPGDQITGWISQYTEGQKAALDSIPAGQVGSLINKLRQAWREDRQIFVFGNGGSAANASHFITDLGKGASDKMGKRFRCLSLNDNAAWLTALGNDYSYEDVFVRQLENYARPGDLGITMSVSGSSPNLVKAITWARENGLHTVALVGARRGKLAEIAHDVLVVDSHHYGHVEDAHMGICHMLCYAFMEDAVT